MRKINISHTKIIENKGEYGLVDKFGNIIIPFGKYEKIEKCSGYGLFKVYNNSYVGIYNLNLKKTVIEPLYYDIIESKINDKLVFKVRTILNKETKGSRYGLYDEKGNMIIPSAWGGLEFAPKGYIYVYTDMIDEYSSVSEYPLVSYLLDYEGEIIKDLRDYGFGSILNYGDRVFVNLSPFNEYGYPNVKRKCVTSDIYAMFDLFGNQLTEFEYKIYDKEFDSNGLLILRNENDHIGVIDKDGNQIIPFEFDDIFKIELGYACEIDRETYIYVYDGRTASILC